MNKKSKQELVNKMKDQVPVVLLNQWLNISPEKSHFARKEIYRQNSDEMSVYSSESMSQALSIKGNSLKPTKNSNRRNSLMITQANMNSALDKLGLYKTRRMTILNNINMEDIGKNGHDVIKEVDDLSSSSTSRSVSRQSKNIDDQKQIPNKQFENKEKQLSEDESEEEKQTEKKENDCTSNNKGNSSTGDDSNGNIEIEVHLLDSKKEIPKVQEPVQKVQLNNFASTSVHTNPKTSSIQSNLAPREAKRLTDKQQRNFIIRKARSITANKVFRTPNHSKKRTMNNKMVISTNEFTNRKCSGGNMNSPFLFGISHQNSIQSKLTTALTPLKSNLRYTHKQSSIPRIQKTSQLLINGKGFARGSIPSLNHPVDKNIDLKETCINLGKVNCNKFMTPKLSKRNNEKFSASFKKTFYPFQINGSKIQQARP